MTKPVTYYIKELIQIALPIVIGNLGFILIGLGDVLIAGHHSTNTLAAISIATAITNCIQTFGIGFIASVSPVISNYRGEKKVAKKYFYPTLRFAFVLAFFIMLVVMGCIPLIDFLRFDPVLVPMIKQYMFITALATFGGYLHVAVKEFLQAYEIVMFPNLLNIAAVILNIVLNIVLVFGWGWIPSLGVVGLAIASFVVRYFMGFVLLIYCLKIMRFENYSEFAYYKQLIQVGLPISAAILVEFVAFNIIAIAMGRVAGIYAAAQNLVCTLTTVSFMIPFAISNAIAVKVGFANGAKNYIDLKRYVKTGVFMSLLVMAISAVIFASFPEIIVRIFTNDINLINICVPILYIIAVFQIFDGLQVSLAGICKGIKKTHIVLFANFLAYWLLSIPLGFIFGFKYKMGIMGFWYGLLISAVVLCLIIIKMLHNYFKTLPNRNVHK